MLKKNDVLTLSVTALNSNFQGVARHDGMVIFIPYALPGETVSAVIVLVKKTYAAAKLLNVLSPSPRRQEPLCASYKKCGGCACQHMPYEDGLAHKKQIVQDNYLHIAKIDIDVFPPVGMENPWRYRNKTASPVQTLPDGRTASGFFAPRSHRLVQVEDCPISMPQSADINRAVLAWMADRGVSAYDEARHEGVVRHIVSRVSRKGDCAVLLVINAARLPHPDELIKRLQTACPAVSSVSYSVNRERGNTILGDGCVTVWGKTYLEETLLGLSFRISPMSFFQVNPVQTEKLYGKALELARVSGTEIMADVYCGAGTISLCFAPRVRKVVGIEIVPEAIENAAANAKLNGIENAEFHLGRAEEVLPRLVQKGLKPDLVMLDPPRKGAAPEVLQSVADCGVQKILYISCHPATQARDAAYLAERGYLVRHVQPVDMFCQTAAIESICLMEKAE